MSVKKWVAAWAGAHRPRLIVVFALTRASAERSLASLKARQIVGLPCWCFCAEPETDPLPGFDRFFGNATSANAAAQLKTYWCAWSLVTWTGEAGSTRFKLAPLLRPPFRILILNENGDCFGLPMVPKHSWRRLSEARENLVQLIKDVAAGSLAWIARTSRQKAEFLAAVGLRGLALAAKIARPLVRTTFRRVKGTKHLAIRLPRLRDLSFVEIPLVGREWSQRRIEAMLEHSDASIVVFREEGERADPSPLLRLLTGPETFCAAIQIQHTDWRKRVLAKFPVRKLQPGEVSATLAPYSTLIAIRRDVLMRFGVPDVKSSGAAFMLLGWQAAAAGWRCLNLGLDRPVTQEMDVALEDATFVLRVVRSQELRSLSPVNAALSRGNIATSQNSVANRPGRPNVLVISPYLPYPLSHGGAVRIFNLCRVLAARVNFILVCFREAQEHVHYDVLHRVFREVYVVDNDEKHQDRSVPRQIAEYRNSAMQALIRNVSETRAIDLLQIEYTQMAEYRNCVGPDVPVLLVEHDITFTLHNQIARSNPTPEAQRERGKWFDFETRAVGDVESIWTMSDLDRDFLIHRGVAPRRIHTVRNGVDLHRFQPHGKSNPAPRVLFVGSFRHLPNLLAFEVLRNSIMPAIWKSVPETTLHVIAGPQYEKSVAAARKDGLLQAEGRVLIDAFVQDVRPAYRDADVVAIPLPVSAGTNIKLMEAMACGRPVVSTPVACAGLDLRDGVELMIRPVDAGFAEAVIKLMVDRDLRETIARKARRTAEELFGWDAIGREALRFYETSIERARSSVAV